MATVKDDAWAWAQNVHLSIPEHIGNDSELEEFVVEAYIDSVAAINEADALELRFRENNEAIQERIRQELAWMRDKGGDEE